MRINEPTGTQAFYWPFLFQCVIGYRGGEEKKAFWAGIFKTLYVSNAVWRKKALLQILSDLQSCPVGILCFNIVIIYENLILFQYSPWLGGLVH